MLRLVRGGALCGSVHYAPNALTGADDYDLNLTNKVWFELRQLLLF